MSRTQLKILFVGEKLVMSGRFDSCRAKAYLDDKLRSGTVQTGRQAIFAVESGF